MLAPTLRRDLNSVGPSPYQQSTRVLDSWRQHPPDHEWQGNQAIPGPATRPRSGPMNKYRGTPPGPETVLEDRPSPHPGELCLHNRAISATMVEERISCRIRKHPNDI